MLNKRQIEQLARNSSIKGIRYYMQRVHEDVDILSGEEKRQILEEMEKIIEEIKDRDKRNKGELQKEIEAIKEYINSPEFLDWNLGFKLIDELEYRKDRINKLLGE